MDIRKRALLMGFILLVFSILACTINVGGPAYPAQQIPVSTVAVGDLFDSVGTAEVAGLESGQLTLTLTETQLTSFLAYKLQSQSRFRLTNPQVYLRDGQIQMYATAQQGRLQATVYVAVSAGVDELGQLKITVTSVDFGPLPVPAGLKDTITASLQEAYTGAIGPVATGFRLDSITIADGLMTVVGRIK
jgi:hypothetical protein